MKIKRKIIRKRTKSLKKIAFATIYIVAIVLISIGSYFLYSMISPKPIYISPLSASALLISGSKSVQGIDTLRSLLKGKHVDYSKINTTDSSYIVTLKEGSVIVFSRQKDLLAQFSSLQLIISRLTMEGKQFLRLDLSFDKPVIVLQK